MGALNKTETEMLRDVRKLLQHIAKHGYLPDAAEDRTSLSAIRANYDLKDADKNLHTLIQMKGYYPK